MVMQIKKMKVRKKKMNDIVVNIIMVIMVILGVVPTVAIMIGIPVTIIYKLIRMTKGYKITD